MRMQPMKIVEVSTSACQTFFDVEYFDVTRRVRLWAITGGQLALALDCAPYYEERKNICDLYTDDKCRPGKGRNFFCYAHQDTDNLIGPRIKDLWEGDFCFRQFIVRAWIDAALYEKRAAIMVEIMGEYGNLKSPRFHHKENREYFRAEFSPVYGGSWRTSPVCHQSANASGPFCSEFSQTYYQYMTKNWISFAEHIDAIMRTCEQRTGNRPWKLNHLNDEEFAQYVAAIRKVQGKSDVTA